MFPAKKAVRSIYPEAIALKTTVIIDASGKRRQIKPGFWFVIGERGKLEIGIGPTENAAWASAAAKLGD